MAADPRSLEAIYAEHIGFVWRSLRRLGVDERDRTDLTQEVFLIVHRKLATFDQEAKMTTWLFGICLRVASDYRRSARVRREVLGGTAEDERDLAPDACEAAERAQARETLYAILDDMPFDQRVVFCAFELEGLSGQEIAALVDVPIGTVKSRLRLARAAFDEGLARRRSAPHLLSPEGEEA